MRKPLDFMQRGEVMDALGVSRDQLRRMQTSGKIPFVKDEKGTCQFARDVVARMAAERGRVVGDPSGAIAANILSLHDQRWPWPEIANATQQSLEVVRALIECASRRGVERPQSCDAEEMACQGDDDSLDSEDGSVDAWQREQAEAHRLAQEQHQHEEDVWRQEREKMRQKAATDGASLTTSEPPSSEGDPDAPPGEEEDDTPIDMDLVFRLLAEMLGDQDEPSRDPVKPGPPRGRKR